MTREAIRADAEAVVSFENEQLILVNEADEPVGHASKARVHDGDGVLHRAFSLFVFNPAGELLLQRRSDQKRLWPGFWSNSCCSHPRAGEEMDEATHRRLHQELGVHADLEYLYKFQYQANFRDLGAEHELCWVYLGRTGDSPRINRNEISEWRFVDPKTLADEIDTGSGRFTPWFKMEWARITESFSRNLARYTNRLARESA